MTTIGQKVNEAIDHLRTLDQPGLTAWAKSNSMDSRAGFSQFKKALLANGINYDALRSARLQEKREAIRAAVTHEVTLFSDAKASLSRFAIVSENREPVWFGRFFDDDRDFNGEQSSGEMAAAKKAVWLASKIAQTVGGVVKLHLKVDAEWLVWANATDGSGGKAVALRAHAEKLGVALFVEHIPGTDNPADQYTVCDGYKKWQDTDLSALARAVR